jgi:calcineurin-like phosphoesterase family protein
MSEINLDTWIISDTHFGHYNMIKLCGRPLNFNEKIINNWNKLVDKNCHILHLGDVAIWFGPTRDMWHKNLSNLPGYKTIIRGNHDEQEKYYYTIMCKSKMLDDKISLTINKIKIIFSHEPQESSDEWDVNIHGHVHNNAHRNDYNFDWENDPRWINVSIEVMDYKPWKLGDILEKRLS